MFALSLFLPSALDCNMNMYRLHTLTGHIFERSFQYEAFTKPCVQQLCLAAHGVLRFDDDTTVTVEMYMGDGYAPLMHYLMMNIESHGKGHRVPQQGSYAKRGSPFT
jgi:hypothetical protein